MASQRGKQAALSTGKRAGLVKEMGPIGGQLGSPRMAGRIVGCLMLGNAHHDEILDRWESYERKRDAG